MNSRIIKALLKKDSRLFVGNRFYLLITIAGIMVYIALYFALPSESDNSLKLAMYSPKIFPAFSSQNPEQGIKIDNFNDLESMKSAVSEGRYQAAIALPPDVLQTWQKGQKPQIDLYYQPETPFELREAVVKIVEEMAYAQTGQALDYRISAETLGTDLQGSQIALRDRLRPLLAVFILLVEILSLASLISIEIEQGTARAILITPLRVSELFFAKGLLGTGLALGQAVLFMLLAGGFNQQPFIILTILLVGSLMVVGIAFLLASWSRDVNAVTGWGLLVLVILAIPGLGTALPGLLSDWAKIIPTYYLTDTINKVSNYALGWSDIKLNLIILATTSVILIWAGMVALRRRYQ
jgi:ABC-2 type transport system permease protein